MSEVRVIQARPPQRDGVPLVTGKVSVDIEGAKNLYGGSKTRKLSPAEARLRDEDRWVGEETTGADNLYVSGGITVKTDQQLFEAAHRESGERLSESAARRKVAGTASEVAKLRDDFHTHAAKLQAMAAQAKGDSSREAMVAAQVRQSAAVGAALKERGVL